MGSTRNRQVLTLLGPGRIVRVLSHRRSNVPMWSDRLVMQLALVLLLVLVLLSISSEQGLRRAPIKHMSS